MQAITQSRHAVNISTTERFVSAVGGGILAGLGLRRRSPMGIALALIGGDLVRRGITGHSFLYPALGLRTASRGQGAETTSIPYELGMRVDKAVTIGCPRAEVYGFFRNLANLPRFMRNVESVRELPDGRSHWVAKGPAGRSVEWDAVVHNEIKNERLAWRSLPGSQIDSAGTVIFLDAPGGRGTEVHVELQYNPPAGRLGAAVAALWGKDPARQVEEDLHRLQQILEAGEIPTIQGQPSGRAARHARSRTVEHTSEASFPASDAPAYNR
jgi:uncharacterized membrane protein